MAGENVAKSSDSLLVRRPARRPVQPRPNPGRRFILLDSEHFFGRLDRSIFELAHQGATNALASVVSANRPTQRRRALRAFQIP
jgi:hypothetical protein